MEFTEGELGVISGIVEIEIADNMTGLRTAAEERDAWQDRRECSGIRFRAFRRGHEELGHWGVFDMFMGSYY